MSTATTTQNTDNTLWTDYDFAKLFIWDNRYAKATYTNPTGSEVVLVPGTLLGKITASGKLLPLVAAAGDGSNIPVGVLAQGATVAIAASVDLFYCTQGDVAAGLLIFNAAETLDTVVTGRTLGDRLKADTLGINPVVSDELTVADNS